MSHTAVAPSPPIAVGAGSPPWVLGIDVGTSSTKAILFDSRGVPAPGIRVQIGYSPRTDGHGATEFDADVLVEFAAQAVDGVLELAGDRRNRIAAVGCCSFWHSMVGVRAGGEPAGPVYIWADTRPGSVIHELRLRTDARALQARTGCPLHSSYFPARLAWLRAARPEEFAHAERWLSPAEYLYTKLFGAPCTSLSMASATGLFDQDRRQWDGEALDLAGVALCRLPELDADDPPARGLARAWAEQWPELAEIPWARAIGDGAAGNVGSGCLTPRRAAINLGTSGAIRVGCGGDPICVPPGLWRYRIDKDRALVGGAFSDGGNVSDWCAGVLAHAPSGPVERDAHGLTILPFLGGERSTGWRPGAAATIHGLSLRTTASDIRQAFREAVALRFAAVAQLLRRLFPQIHDAVLSGGAPARSPEWHSLLADALGMPVRGVVEPEASCRGAALVALRKAGLIATEDQAVDIAGGAVEPDPHGHAALQTALARQDRLYARMVAPL